MIASYNIPLSHCFYRADVIRLNNCNCLTWFLRVCWKMFHQHNQVWQALERHVCMSWQILARTVCLLLRHEIAHSQSKIVPVEENNICELTKSSNQSPHEHRVQTSTSQDQTTWSLVKDINRARHFVVESQAIIAGKNYVTIAVFLFIFFIIILWFVSWCTGLQLTIHLVKESSSYCTSKWVTPLKLRKNIIAAPDTLVLRYQVVWSIWQTCQG